SCCGSRRSGRGNTGSGGTVRGAGGVWRRGSPIQRAHRKSGRGGWWRGSGRRGRGALARLLPYYSRKSAPVIALFSDREQKSYQTIFHKSQGRWLFGSELISMEINREQIAWAAGIFEGEGC